MTIDLQAIRERALAARERSWAGSLIPLGSGIPDSFQELAMCEKRLAWDADTLLDEINRLQAMNKQLTDNIKSARSAMGTGNCKLNTCEGCKADKEAAIGYLSDALAAYEAHQQEINDAKVSPEVRRS